jgi:hypothetical protein
MLETGTENVEHPNEYECGRAVKIPIWDFQEYLHTTSWILF